MEIQLKKQQNLYHAVRNDKNILNKGLTEAHDEISDLKGKLRVLNQKLHPSHAKWYFLKKLVFGHLLWSSKTDVSHGRGAKK